MNTSWRDRLAYWVYRLAWWIEGSGRVYHGASERYEACREAEERLKEPINQEALREFQESERAKECRAWEKP